MSKSAYLAIGTYTGQGSDGIYGIAISEDGHFIGETQLLAQQESPSYMCINRAHSILYAVSEPEWGAGRMRAYQVERDFICCSERRSAGGPLCYIMLPEAEDRAIVCSYMDATVQVYPLGRRGDYQPLFCLRRHIGHSKVVGRQDSAHVHSVTASPEGRYVIACDLGTDQLVVYYMDRDSTKLRLERDMTTTLPAGTGPRHMIFGRKGQQAYVVGELSSEVLVLDYQEGKSFSLRQRIRTKEGEGENLAAAIRGTSDGRYLYVSNRGEDTIVCFAIQGDGSLIKQGTVPCGGRTPRDFVLTPDERYLICANQDSDSLVSFKRNEDGTLRRCDIYAGIVQPACLLAW